MGTAMWPDDFPVESTGVEKQRCLKDLCLTSRFRRDMLGAYLNTLVRLRAGLRSPRK